MRGGKRLRPALLLVAVECVCDWRALSSAVVDLSCGIELLQTYLLIHDDWMDGDDVRRGGPDGARARCAKRYGDAPPRRPSAAILAGDFASALAQDLVVARPRARAAVRRRAGLHRACSATWWFGQTLDVLNSRRHRGDARFEDRQLHGARPDRARPRARWRERRAVGCARVLRQPARRRVSASRRPDRRVRRRADTGKPAGNDLRAGKRTAPVRWRLERRPEETEPQRRSVLGTDNDVRAHELIIESGAREGRDRGAHQRAQPAGARAAVEARVLRRDGAKLARAASPALMCDRDEARAASVRAGGRAPVAA